MVSSMGCFRMRNFTGLNGSMRPRPQSGRDAIQALASRSRSSRAASPGMIANRYSSRSTSESRVFFAISARMRVGGEARVGRAGDQEAQVLLLAPSGARPRRDDRRRSSGRARKLAEWHTAQLMPTRGKPTVTFEKPIGISWPSLRQDAERGMAAGRRQKIREDPRQHEPDPVRHALFRLGADRSEQEVLLVGGEVRRRLLPEEPVVDQDRRRPPARRAPDRDAARATTEPAHQALDAAGFAAAIRRRR